MEYDQTIQLEIEALLRQKIGLNPESLGARSIMRSVKRGMRTGKMQGLSDYLVGLQTSPQLFEALVESVVVPETSFFRNRASFVFLRQWLSQEWSKQRARRQAAGLPLRVLSMPCSTGEEPYSVAITLIEEGLMPGEFQIDAVDISHRAIAKAKEGIYSPYAFRRQTYRSDDKYFTLGVPGGAKGKRATQRYYLVESVRRTVAFCQGNVLNPTLLADKAPYDVVFCRNLLIYFDKDARDRTFTLLDRVLTPGSLLFVGYAETGLVPQASYSPIPYPQTFAYRKRDSDTTESVAEVSSNLVNSIAHRLTNATLLSSATRGRPQAELSEPSSAANSLENNGILAVPRESDLVELQQLADRGQLEQAIVGCDRYLAEHPTVAAAHLLRGELHQAMGDEGAAEACFEKAIYLDAELAEALTHLMFIKEAREDFSGAAVIRSRLQRLSKGFS